MEMKKLISLTAALAVTATAFGSLAFNAAAEDTETVYNFSDLTEESYATKNKTVEIFEGALKLSASENASPFTEEMTALSPLGKTLNFTSALKSKKLSVSMQLAAGETMVVYYRGSDSAGTAAKAIGMQITDDASNVVATENYSENKEKKVYAISYTAVADGTYTACDSVGSNRTLVYAVAKSTVPYSADTTPGPAVTPTPDPDATLAPTFTPSPSPTPKATVDPDAKQEISIVKQQGWLENAYITWTNTAAVDRYNVYIKKDGGEYTKIDDELVRYYGGYYRADAVGLSAGNYTMKVAPVVGDAEGGAVESGTLEVKPYIREGFAFDKTSSHYNADGVGAYKNDGTLKDGAKIVYITDKNKDSVKFNVVTDKNKGTVTECTGLTEIMSAREKNNAEDTPLAIRLVGKVTAPSGVNSSGYIQAKGTSNVTIEGIGDDSGTYHWSLLLRETNNIEVRNIAVMEFYDDGISLDTNNFNDWIHNCDIFYGQNRGGDQKKGDGSLDVKSGSDYCSFSYNHFWDSGKTSLCGMKVDSYKGYHMTYYGNWFDHSDSRHPRVRGDQVHVYNNYYDGTSKYGVGACTGSSVFVENNVFRNALHPVLTSRQGTDALGDGTFSGEDGGTIKMYNNAIYGGISIIDGKKNNTNNADAYVVDSRDEKVPDTYTAVQGGGKYTNFDTADNMYEYSVLPTDQVVDTVTKYAGRVENGDFYHEFDDSVDDASYDRNPVLGGELEKYTSSVVSEYVTGEGYPATEGASEPSAKPTQEPFDPDLQPTSKPSGTPGDNTSQGSSVMWRATDNAKSMSAGEVLYIALEETDGIPDEGDWLTLIGGGLEYKASNKSISGIAFTGKMNAPSGQSSPTIKENGTNGASLKVLTKDSGTLSVYIKLNSGKTFYVTDADGNVIKEYKNDSSASEYTAVSAEIEGGKEYHAFGDGTNSEFWGASFTVKNSDDPKETTEPSETTKPSNEPSETTKPSSEPSETTKPSDEPSENDCVKITAEYDEQGRLVGLECELAKSSEAENKKEGTTKTIYWKSLKSMEPVK